MLIYFEADFVNPTPGDLSGSIEFYPQPPTCTVIAEVVKVGEPYSTIILALSVTVLEASIIVSLMLTGGVGAGRAKKSLNFGRGFTTADP